MIVALIALVAGWNPLAVADRTAPASLRTRTGLVVGSVIVGGLAVLSEPILELLSLSPATFRTAAGTVVALTGLRHLVGPQPRRDDPQGDDLIVGILAVLSPASVLAALSVSADHGWLIAILTIGIAATLSWLAATQPSAGTGIIGRYGARATGLVAIAAGVSTLVDGIRSV